MGEREQQRQSGERAAARVVVGEREQRSDREASGEEQCNRISDSGGREEQCDSSGDQVATEGATATESKTCAHATTDELVDAWQKQLPAGLDWLTDPCGRCGCRRFVVWG